MAKTRIAFALGTTALRTQISSVVARLRERKDMHVRTIRTRDLSRSDVAMDNRIGRAKLAQQAREIFNDADLVITGVRTAPGRYGLIEAAIETAPGALMMYQDESNVFAQVQPQTSRAVYLTIDEKARDAALKNNFNAYAVGRPQYDAYSKLDITGLTRRFRATLPLMAQNKKIIVFYGENLDTPGYKNFVSSLVDVIARNPNVFLVYRGPYTPQLTHMFDASLGGRWATDRHASPYPSMAGGDQHVAYTHSVLNDIIMLNAWSMVSLGVPVSGASCGGIKYPWLTQRGGWPCNDLALLEQGILGNFGDNARHYAWVNARSLVGDRKPAGERIEILAETLVSTMPRARF